SSTTSGSPSVSNSTQSMAPPSAVAALPPRDLDQAELLELVRTVASDAPLWREHISFSDEQRHYVQLHRDAHVDIWLLCWTPSNDTGWHDHDISSGAIAVVQGCLEEQVLTVGAPDNRRAVGAGQSYSF